MKKIYVGTLFAARADGPWWANDDVQVKAAPDAKLTDETGKQIGHVRRVWMENGSVVAEMEVDGGFDIAPDAVSLGGPWPMDPVPMPEQPIEEIAAQDGPLLNFD